MESTGDDELADELYELTRRLRSQLLRHAAQGTWAAPGGPTPRLDGAASGDATPALDRTAEDAGPGAAVPGPALAGAPSHAVPELADDAPLPRGHRIPHAPPEVPHPAAREDRAVAPVASTHAPVATAAPGQGALEIDPRPAVIAVRSLPQIREDLGDCKRCKLHTTRRSIVFGVGAADTPLMFVGEAPGEQEDRRGEPFVGPAGELLDKMIEAMGWTRSAVYIANTTKCRPPGNRNPQPDELSQCMPFLHAQIAAIAPRIIVALGRPASNQLLEIDAPISTLRGRFHDYPRHTADRHSLKIMPTFHPAYLLRDPDKKRAAWSDLKLVMAELTRLGISPPRPPA